MFMHAVLVGREGGEMDWGCTEACRNAASSPSRCERVRQPLDLFPHTTVQPPVELARFIQRLQAELSSFPVVRRLFAEQSQPDSVVCASLFHRHWPAQGAHHQAESAPHSAPAHSTRVIHDVTRQNHDHFAHSTIHPGLVNRHQTLCRALSKGKRSTL